MIYLYMIFFNLDLLSVCVCVIKKSLFTLFCCRIEWQIYHHSASNHIPVSQCYLSQLIFLHKTVWLKTVVWCIFMRLKERRGLVSLPNDKPVITTYDSCTAWGIGVGWAVYESARICHITTEKYKCFIVNWYIVYYVHGSCKDGVFRRYQGARTKEDFLSFIEEKKWQTIEPVSSWFGPSSFM